MSVGEWVAVIFSIVGMAVILGMTGLVCWMGFELCMDMRHDRKQRERRR